MGKPGGKNRAVAGSGYLREIGFAEYISEIRFAKYGNKEIIEVTGNYVYPLFPYFRISLLLLV
jgi:hypothetical protein